jgi:hypothetical protein
VLHYDGKGERLGTEKEFGDSEFIVDFRFLKKDKGQCIFDLRRGEGGTVTLMLTTEGRFLEATHLGGEWGNTDLLKPIGEWNRLGASLKGDTFKVTLNGKDLTDGKINSALKTGAFILRPSREMEFGNLFVRPLEN